MGHFPCQAISSVFILLYSYSRIYFIVLTENYLGCFPLVVVTEVQPLAARMHSHIPTPLLVAVSIVSCLSIAHVVMSLLVCYLLMLSSLGLPSQNT